MLVERGLHVDHTTIYRWVQHYAPQVEKRVRAQLGPTNDPWRADETYTKGDYFDNVTLESGLDTHRWGRVAVGDWGKIQPSHAC